MTFFRCPMWHLVTDISQNNWFKPMYQVKNELRIKTPVFFAHYISGFETLGFSREILLQDFNSLQGSKGAVLTVLSIHFFWVPWVWKTQSLRNIICSVPSLSPRQAPLIHCSAHSLNSTHSQSFSDHKAITNWLKLSHERKPICHFINHVIDASTV